MVSPASNRSTLAAARHDRHALVLVLVLIVVMMVALAGFTFAELMLTENKAARLHGDQLQLRQALHSGKEHLKLFFEQPRSVQELAGGSMDNPTHFRSIALLDDPGTLRSAPNALRFSVVTPTIASPGQPQSAGVRFGVENESGRLHLADLLRFDKHSPGSGRRALMQLPGMTEATADAILDWIDADSEPRAMGAEDDYYSGLAEPYAVRNGLPECIEELLLVKGVTRELLFGADANYNRQVESHELSKTADGPHGGTSALVPWSWLLTLYSGQRNQTSTGMPRINLNGTNLALLEQQLTPAVGAPLAAFIVAYRQNGPYTGSDSAIDQVPPIRDAKPPRFEIKSMLDLLYSKVAVAADDSDDKPKVYASPFPPEPQAQAEMLNKLLDLATVFDMPVTRGLVSDNHAPATVLQAVPGIEPQLAQQIVAARENGANESPTNRRHPTWLYFEGLVDFRTMKNLLPYLSTGGDVVRAQIVAHRDQPGTTARAEVIIDATTTPARELLWRDLQLHGQGYPLEWLTAESTVAARN